MSRWSSSNFASSTGRLTVPQCTCFSLAGSFTTNLSFGERPVCWPVLQTSGPSAARFPSPRRSAPRTALPGPGSSGRDPTSQCPMPRVRAPSQPESSFRLSFRVQKTSSYRSSRSQVNSTSALPWVARRSRAAGSVCVSPFPRPARYAAQQRPIEFAYDVGLMTNLPASARHGRELELYWFDEDNAAPSGKHQDRAAVIHNEKTSSTREADRRHGSGRRAAALQGFGTCGAPQSPGPGWRSRAREGAVQRPRRTASAAPSGSLTATFATPTTPTRRSRTPS